MGETGKGVEVIGKISRLQEQEAIKTYLQVLETAGIGNRKYPVLACFHGMDWVSQNVVMAQEEFDVLWKKAGAMQEGKEKARLYRTLHQVADAMAMTKEYFSQAQDTILAGVERSIELFRRGKPESLEKPFSVMRVEKELWDVAESLKSAFIVLDRQMEEMEDVARPMRNLMKLIKQTNDAVHEAARYTESLRPKASHIIKREVLAEGLFRKGERQPEEKMQGKELSEKGEKPSLRKRLQEMKVAETYSYDISAGQRQKKTQKKQER